MLIILLVLVALILILIIFAGVGNAILVGIICALVFAVASFLLKKIFNGGNNAIPRQS